VTRVEPWEIADRLESKTVGREARGGAKAPRRPRSVRTSTSTRNRSRSAGRVRRARLSRRSLVIPAQSPQPTPCARHAS
jgi:hypothetical protein